VPFAFELHPKLQKVRKKRMLPQAVLHDELGLELDRIIQELSSKIGLGQMSGFEEVCEAADRVLSGKHAELPISATAGLRLSA
jgi:hypothetical protein